MAIKALKQSVSISETQKMIHQWKRRGVNDPTITKLLDLYLGMPAYMNSQGIYPLCNFYDLRLSLRFSYTSALVAAVTNCQSFGMIWNEAHTKNHCILLTAMVSQRGWKTDGTTAASCAENTARCCF